MCDFCPRAAKLICVPWSGNKKDENADWLMCLGMSTLLDPCITGSSSTAFHRCKSDLSLPSSTLERSFRAHNVQALVIDQTMHVIDKTVTDNPALHYSPDRCSIQRDRSRAHYFSGSRITSPVVSCASKQPTYEDPKRMEYC